MSEMSGLERLGEVMKLEKRFYHRMFAGPTIICVVALTLAAGMYFSWDGALSLKEAGAFVLVSLVLHEIECLRSDVMYYAEIWRRDLK